MGLLSNPRTSASLEVRQLTPDDLPEPSTPPKRRQVQRRLPASTIDELVEAYHEGASVPQLVKRYSISRVTVLSHLERRGIPRRPCVRKLTDADVLAAAEM